MTNTTHTMIYPARRRCVAPIVLLHRRLPCCGPSPLRADTRIGWLQPHSVNTTTRISSLRPPHICKHVQRQGSRSDSPTLPTKQNLTLRSPPLLACDHAVVHGSQTTRRDQHNLPSGAYTLLHTEDKPRVRPQAKVHSHHTLCTHTHTISTHTHTQ